MMMVMSPLMVYGGQWPEIRRPQSQPAPPPPQLAARAQLCGVEKRMVGADRGTITIATIALLLSLLPLLLLLLLLLVLLLCYCYYEIIGGGYRSAQWREANCILHVGCIQPIRSKSLPPSQQTVQHCMIDLYLKGFTPLEYIMIQVLMQSLCQT